MSALFAAERGVLSCGVNKYRLPGLMWRLSSCMEAARGSGMDPNCSVKQAWQDAHRDRQPTG